MRTKRHHNNKGKQQVRTGKTYDSLRFISRKLGLPFRTNAASPLQKPNEAERASDSEKPSEAQRATVSQKPKVIERANSS